MKLHPLVTWNHSKVFFGARFKYTELPHECSFTKIASCHLPRCNILDTFRLLFLSRVLGNDRARNTTFNQISNEKRFSEININQWHKWIFRCIAKWDIVVLYRAANSVTIASSQLNIQLLVPTIYQCLVRRWRSS